MPNPGALSMVCPDFLNFTRVSGYLGGLPHDMAYNQEDECPICLDRYVLQSNPCTPEGLLNTRCPKDSMNHRVTTPTQLLYWKTGPRFVTPCRHMMHLYCYTNYLETTLATWVFWEFWFDRFQTRSNISSVFKTCVLFSWGEFVCPVCRSDILPRNYPSRQDRLHFVDMTFIFLSISLEFDLPDNLLIGNVRNNTEFYRAHWDLVRPFITRFTEPAYADSLLHRDY